MVSAYVGGFLPNSLSNGIGTRSVVFFEGCLHKCHGCQNEHMWNQKEESLTTVEEICNKIQEQVPMITGITLSGGDPFMQPGEATIVAKFAHSLGLNVWTYTGYTYETLKIAAELDYEINSLLNETDILVDGRYDETLADDSLKYIGSSNQRILCLKGGDLIEQADNNVIRNH